MTKPLSKCLLNKGSHCDTRDTNTWVLPPVGPPLVGGTLCFGYSGVKWLLHVFSPSSVSVCFPGGQRRSCLLLALMGQNDSSVYPVMFGTSLTYWGLVHSYGQGECDLKGCDWELHPFSIRTPVVFFVGLL